LRMAEARRCEPLLRRLWQRNYFEHVIRTDAALQRIRTYIQENPGHWAADPENPEATSHEPDPIES